MASNLGAAKRLRKELQNLERAALSGDPDDADVYLRPSSPDSVLRWTALLKGPSETPYEGGVFQLTIRCDSDYPLAPPSITFVTKVFHPNVHFRTGDVCLDILKKEWSPAWGLQAACRAVLALLSDPDADSPLNCDAGNMVRNGDMTAFRTTARMYAVENAMFIDWPLSKKVAMKERKRSGRNAVAGTRVKENS
mmetsp:Transcript_13606/g.39726  ORF Transcript_13606/g.39726 Transcript_13606/m.39726 type:complete len:194 (+) Transcript_13606:221-802(+)|eukprot:CAMPEP_0113552612 /NCGR_PEP_ID=MMETSP0015_2-20120614/15162_1 /TAXON_ID=2838 /ORGANISM="Odontella" /LENGTH=193 /DNA_ID=CAMNT_0000453605 /DNA_START=167 /DNA_END=748 /DNA_ORIENTATION=- /assembly_acc=CAM_ASM_000160